MDIKDLLEVAESEDGLGSSDLDVFLRQNGFTASDLSERIYIDDLYFFYSEYYYQLYNELPNRNNISKNSDVFKLYKLKMNRTINGRKAQTWGLKCSKQFKESFELWQQNQKWSEKFTKLRAIVKRRTQMAKKQTVLDIVKKHMSG